MGRLALAPMCLACGLVACVTTDPIGSGGSASNGGSDSGGFGHGGAVIDDTGSGASVPSDGGAGGSFENGGSSSSTICGDAVCGIDETCDTCPDDCSCDPACGDGTCDDATETCSDCPDDCGACSVCGDGTCSPDEDCDLCYEDCGVCACMPDTFEPNNGSPTATVVQKGVDYCDLSICSADFDWFEFQVTSGFTAKVTFHQAEGDLDMEIYSGITGDYVSGSYSADDDESVTLTGLQSGTYWARVYGDMAENPDYCFRVD